MGQDYEDDYDEENDDYSKGRCKVPKQSATVWKQQPNKPPSKLFISRTVISVAIYLLACSLSGKLAGAVESLS